VNDPYRTCRPWRLYVFLAVAGLVVLVAAGLVAQTALTPRHPENYLIPPMPPLPGGTSATRPPAKTHQHTTRHHSRTP
jgi:hypothetical protein